MCIPLSHPYPKNSICCRYIPSHKTKIASVSPNLRCYQKKGLGILGSRAREGGRHESVGRGRGEERESLASDRGRESLASDRGRGGDAIPATGKGIASQRQGKGRKQKEYMEQTGKGRVKGN